MKKIKQMIKKHYKRTVILIVSLISCFVILSVPCMAETGFQTVNADLTENLALSQMCVYYSKSPDGPWSYSNITYNFAINDGITFIYLENKDGTFDPYYYRFIYWFDLKSFNSAYGHRIQFDVTCGLQQSYVVASPSNVIAYISADNKTQINGEYSIVTNGDSETDACYRFDSGFIEPNYSFGRFGDYGNLTCRTIFQLPEYTDSLLIRIDNIQFSEISPENYPSYSAPDSSSMDNYMDTENQINNANQAGINATNDMFSGFSGILSGDSSLSRGLMAATAIVNGFLDVDFLDSLINFALVLGIFAFFLGMGFFIGSSQRKSYDIRMRNKQDRQDRINSARYIEKR